MKKVTAAILACAILAIGVVFTFAQTGGEVGKGRGFGKRGGHNRGGHIQGGMMLRGVDLTDEQKVQMKAIREASRTKVLPIREALKASQAKLREATANGAFDEGAVAAIANEQAGLQAQLTVERARVMSQTFALLTDDQKAKAAEAREKMKERFKNRGERRGRKGGKKAPAGNEM